MYKRFLRCFGTSTQRHKYSKTLNLPNTSFPNRSSPELIESTILPQTTTKLYKWNEEKKSGDWFILHDGPPYANGDLHIGHLLNKILKDIINRYQLIQGSRIFYKPGWDCHGLPIELKLLEALNKIRAKEKKLRIKSGDTTTKTSKLTPLEIRKLAANHADATIETQRQSFKKFGVMGDWSHPYITKDKEYVIDQLKVFKKMFDKGLVHRQEKPVYWGCENATALAEGELEYNESHKSTAIYVKFPIVEQSPVLSKLGITKLSALIWTSTPWTIPSNKAICINENLEYLVVESGTHGNLIIALDLFDNLLKIDSSLHKVQSLKGSDLLGSSYKNPVLQNDERFPILHGDHVTNTAGTGLVHTLPGHGQDDYFVCLKNGIKPYSPVDNYGKYTDQLPECLQKDLVNKKVLTCNPIIISKLEDNSMLLHQEEIVHSYPYDWRSKKPIIIRSTPQWFINVDKIKSDTISALDKVEFYPQRGSRRLVSFIKTRNEWCISRQRSWGVPIPVLYEAESGKPLLTDESIDQIIKVISEQGPDLWFESDVEKWLPPQILGNGVKYVKGTDTMDVWFDSGTSWNVVANFLKEQGIERDYLADIYLEGSDQHRGWFQSSILTKTAVDNKVLPYRKIITHGFTLDDKGLKMSKSIGNMILPSVVIEGDRNFPGIGIDGLRLWVAQSDYSTDISVGFIILSRVGDNLKKIRFTLKFLLGNLQNNFEPVPFQDLRPIDKMVLSKTIAMQKEIKSCYESFNYSKIIRELNQNMNVLLSSIYFDISKDSLYTDSVDSFKRRCIQTVLSQLYQVYISILSPILPIVTQEAWNHTPGSIKSDHETPFHKGWYEIPFARDEALELEFDKVWNLKNKFKLLLDRGNRVDKLIKNSLELSVNVNVDINSSFYQLLQRHESDLCDYFLTSQFKINSKLDNVLYSEEFEIEGVKLHLEVLKSELHKCPRCWKYDSEVEDELCNRCESVVK